MQNVEILLQFFLSRWLTLIAQLEIFINRLGQCTFAFLKLLAELPELRRNELVRTDLGADVRSTLLIIIFCRLIIDLVIETRDIQLEFPIILGNDF